MVNKLLVICGKQGLFIAVKTQEPLCRECMHTDLEIQKGYKNE